MEPKSISYKSDNIYFKFDHMKSEKCICSNAIRNRSRY